MSIIITSWILHTSWTTVHSFNQTPLCLNVKDMKIIWQHLIKLLTCRPTFVTLKHCHDWAPSCVGGGGHKTLRMTDLFNNSEAYCLSSLRWPSDVTSVHPLQVTGALLYMYIDQNVLTIITDRLFFPWTVEAIEKFRYPVHAITSTSREAFSNQFPPNILVQIRAFLFDRYSKRRSIPFDTSRKHSWMYCIQWFLAFISKPTDIRHQPIEHLHRQRLSCLHSSYELSEQTGNVKAKE